MDIWSIIILFVTLFLSGLTAYIVTRYYGPRYTELAKRRREHFISLKTGVLDPWLKDLKQLDWLGYVCSRLEGISTNLSDSKSFETLFDTDIDPTFDIYTFNSVKARDPDYQYFRFVINHFESTCEYYKILEGWKKYKTDFLKYNSKCLSFIKELELNLVKNTKMPPYYKGPLPKRYFWPTRIVSFIYDELINMIQYEKEWDNRKLVIPPQKAPNNNYILKWTGTELAQSNDEKELNDLKNKIREIINSLQNKKNLTSLIEEKKILKDENSKLPMMVEELIKSIELGKKLKGNCPYCPKLRDI